MRLPLKQKKYFKILLDRINKLDKFKSAQRRKVAPVQILG